MLYYLYGDHLGSTSDITDASGVFQGEQGYFPFGGIRYNSGTLPTDFGFTGQRADTSTGLMYYGARYYDPLIGRFISPDSIVPEPGNPQALNRYSYVINNPLKLVDPSGHCWGIASGIRDIPGYRTTCGNLDMAWLIVNHSDASIGEKVIAGGYIAVTALAHGAFAIGSAGVACGLAGSCAATVESLIGIGTRAGTLGAGAQAMQKLQELASRQINPQAGTTLLGKWPDYWQKAQQLGLNALKIPDEIWNTLTRPEKWIVNRTFLDQIIQRGDAIRLDFSFNLAMEQYEKYLAQGRRLDQMDLYIRELIYLLAHGFRLTERVINGEVLQFLERIAK